jgi:tRNA A-37 threonylcarbamoyl transferase component Bud32
LPRQLGPGEWLGRYQLIKRLAVGGMAEIFLARSQGPDGFEKLVVLKSLLLERADDQAWVQMFLDEARLAATLAHPNVAQVFDVGREGDQRFFTMEYVHGADLRDVMTAAERHGGVPLDVALAIVAGVAAGLHHAHDKTDERGRPLDIVHRDVSPSNVLVSFDGAVKVVDFGIAKAAVRRAATRTGTVKGKAGYMSPEQCRGEVLDRRSDVFAIGILLYQLTTGVSPFAADNEYAILRKVVDEDARPPSELKPGYPKRLEEIVLRALRRSRDERTATAREVQVDLETVAREEGMSLSVVEIARFMEEILGDRRAQPFEAVAAVLGSDEARRLSTTFAAVPSTPRAARRWVRPALAAVCLLLAGGAAAWRAGLAPPRRGRPAAAAPSHAGADGQGALGSAPVARVEAATPTAPAASPPRATPSTVEPPPIEATVAAPAKAAPRPKIRRERKPPRSVRPGAPAPEDLDSPFPR